MGRYAILLVETVAEQQVSYVQSFTGASCIKLDKGELLIAVSEELAPVDNEATTLYNFHLASDKNTTLHLDIDGSSAVLSDPEFMLLQAITTPLDRFKAYKSGKCTWGLSLQVGDTVDVDDSWVDAPVAAIVRYIGEISDHCGTMFGVEIVDEEFSTWGDSDGTWKGVRYFKCKANGGSFVPLDKISRALHVATEDSAKTEVPRAPQDSKEVETTAAITPSGRCDENEATTNLSFEIGSLVQVTDPPLYGVIRVIEKLPGMQEKAAGIELGFQEGQTTELSKVEKVKGRGMILPKEEIDLEESEALRQAQDDKELKKTVETEQIDDHQQREAIRDLEKKKREAETTAAAAWQPPPGAAMTPHFFPSQKQQRAADTAAKRKVLHDWYQEGKMKGFQGERSQTEEEKIVTSGKGKRYEEKEQKRSLLHQQLSEQSPAKHHLEQEYFRLKQQSQVDQMIRHKLQQQVAQHRETAAQAEVRYHQEIEQLQHRLDTALSEMLQLRRDQLLKKMKQKKEIHEEQYLLHEEKRHLQEECTRLQQQVAQHRETAAQTEQHCSLLNQQLSQQSQENQLIRDQLLKEMGDIQEEQHLLHEQKHHLQEECTRLQQQVVQQSEAAAQAEVQYQQEVEALRHRLDTALAEMQQLRPSSRTQVLVEEIDPWKVSRDEVQILSEMGRGAWGWVAKGRFRGQLVAVKSPHAEILDEHTTKRLQREVGIMAQVRHPNLLRIIAAVFDDQVPRLPPLIVTELLDMNLRAAYQNNRLSGASRIPIFRDVAYALHYLHEHQEPIIHRDVSAPNVLLEELLNGMFKAKVSDFGSANLAKLAQTLAEGAIIYAAPETFPCDPHSPPPPQTTKIDVYSYGVLLCEVIKCQLPDPQRFWSVLKQVESEWPFMHELIVSCTKLSPEDRLTMAQVLDKLNQIPRAQPRRRQ